MGHDGDEPPVAVRQGPAVGTGAPSKRRRRKRRGKRSRWPYAAARETTDAAETAAKSGSGIAKAERPPAAPAKGNVRSNAGSARGAAGKSAGKSQHKQGQSPASGRGDGAVSTGRHDADAKPGAAAPAQPARSGNAGSANGSIGQGGDRAVAHAANARDSQFAGHTPLHRGYGGGHPAPQLRRSDPRTGFAAGPYRVAAPAPDGHDLYAALDLGTNNCRLLVAEPNRAGFHVVDAFSRIVRLGEGLTASGRLSDLAQARAIEALHICRTKLEARGVNRARLVATEACRIAENGADFIARVAEETGLTLEVVSRETEARLAVAGCASLIDWQSDGVLLFDIGGGSSELVWLDLKRHGKHEDLTRHIRAWTSLPVGVVTLSERHGGVVVDHRVFEEMVRDVDGMLDGLVEGPDLSQALANGEFHMLGTSGTVTTLAGVHLGLKRYDRRRVDGVWLADSEVSDMIGQLLEMTFAERIANPCIGADRADLVLAGCAILEAIRRRWPCERLRVADRGLREGILTEMMAADGVWRRPNQHRDHGHSSHHGRSRD